MDILKSLCLIWTDLAKNHRYQFYVSSDDIRTFERRAESEGLTFLTTTLPKIGKALDAAHATNAWQNPENFKTRPSVLKPLIVARLNLHDGVPLFMGRAIEFALMGDSSAVDCVRQLSYIFYKLEVDYGKAIVSQFLSQFKQTDHDLGLAFDLELLSQATLGHLARMSRMIARVL